jgi:hypothetical protein
VESKLGPLGMSATEWPIVPAPRWLWWWRICAEWRLAGETEVLGENLSQRHFVRHKSHLTRPGLEPGPPRALSSVQNFWLFGISWSICSLTSTRYTWRRPSNRIVNTTRPPSFGSFQPFIVVHLHTEFSLCNTFIISEIIYGFHRINHQKNTGTVSLFSINQLVFPMETHCTFWDSVLFKLFI